MLVHYSYIRAEHTRIVAAFKEAGWVTESETLDCSLITVSKDFPKPNHLYAAIHEVAKLYNKHVNDILNEDDRDGSPMHLFYCDGDYVDGWTAAQIVYPLG